MYSWRKDIILKRKKEKKNHVCIQNRKKMKELFCFFKGGISCLSVQSREGWERGKFQYAPG